MFARSRIVPLATALGDVEGGADGLAEKVRPELPGVLELAALGLAWDVMPELPQALNATRHTKKARRRIDRF